MSTSTQPQQPLSHTHSHSPSRSSEHNAPSSPSTTVTTPDQSPGADDDIWDTTSDHGGAATDENATSTTAPGQRRPEPILSDLPTLRRQHMTDGYREGLAVGKAQVMQRGFDDGYPYGVELGLRVGAVLGVLEGIVAALSKQAAGGPSGVTAGVRRGRAEASRPVTTEERSTSADGVLAGVTTLYTRAKAELKISELMKVLDDEKVAELEPGGPLPDEIEVVVKRWEEMVLQGMLGGTSCSSGEEGVTSNAGKDTDSAENVV